MLLLIDGSRLIKFSIPFNPDFRVPFLDAAVGLREHSALVAAGKDERKAAMSSAFNDKMRDEPLPFLISQIPMHRLPPLFYTILTSMIAAVSLIGSGCASHTQTVRQRQKVLIVSEPAGAQIEINGQYVGDCPTTVEIEASSDGRFWKDTDYKGLSERHRLHTN